MKVNLLGGKMELQQLLKEAEYKEYFIKGEQLIIVKTKEEKAILYIFEKENEKWFNKKIIQHAYIGKKGITREKNEGDKKTPYGLYKLGFAFGIEKKPKNSKYPYKLLNNNIYWIDDANSKYYNQWVEVTENADKNVQKDNEYNYCKKSTKISWKSAEHLVEYKEQYQYAVVIEYNTINQYDPVQKQGNKLGSAIFLHAINNGATDGCVAIKKEDMEEIITWLKKEKNPQILIY